MKTCIKTTLAAAILAGVSFGIVGCTDESGVKSETKVTGPGGTTTVTDQTTIKKSGENPPPVSKAP